MTELPAPVQIAQEQSRWDRPSSVYLHIPFCPYKCPYCDFVTHVGSPGLVQPYANAVCEEIRHLAATVDVQPMRTVYLGGGTPGMLTPKQMEQLLQTTNDCLRISGNAEITLETNPDAVIESDIAGFVNAGVNRISLGVQSFDPEELKLLGRGHSPQEVTKAVKAIRRGGVTNLGIDLIYGVQRQSMVSWKSTLTTALDMEPDHISMYSLIVEPRTVYKRRLDRGELNLPEDDLVADMYALGCETLDAAGFVHYEVANWAKPGLESRHNLAYWHNEQFLAAGVGAYDYLQPIRSVRVRSVKTYIERMSEGQSVIAESDEITPDIERFETAVMALRLLREGLNRRRWAARFGEDLDATYGTTVQELCRMKLLIDDGESVRIPEAMVPIANEIWERFLPD